MKYAVIEDGVVVNTVEAEAKLVAEWVACPDSAGVEWTYDGVSFTAPVLPEPPPAQPLDYGTQITRLAFRNRFTSAEKVALYTAAASSIPIKIYLDDLAAATFVDLSRADTIASVGALVTAGLLTQNRATVILTTLVIPEEVPV